jgi:hypothetical protein
MTRNNLQSHLTSKIHRLSAGDAKEKADEVGAALFELVPHAKNDDNKGIETDVENGGEDRLFV